MTKENDTLLKETITLKNSVDTFYSIRKPYFGFLLFQVSDVNSDLSGSLSATLEMSVDGEVWADATDYASEVISGSVATGGTYIEKLSDVNPAINFRLKLASGVSGSVLISTRI